ncbi:flap endonuclease-1 [Candidatus Micrarchaeota archaeon]|nr:flap endonuclease-1 [Candidatus Micrarchaeota archaeon]
MGVDLGDLVKREEITLDRLAGKTVAIDAYNALYQFLSIIRQRDGTLLMDRRGRVTSHLSGLFYRTAKLLEAGIKPVYIFDGKPPEMKRRTIEKRIEVREEAAKMWKDALEKGDVEGVRVYAQASTRLTKEMIAEAKQLLETMGIPYLDAPSEGEAEAAYLARKGLVDACASQDYDSLLFGSPILIRNLTISGKRKLPRKDIFVDVVPEMINLEAMLKELGLDMKKLIWIGILTGTDFNKGIRGIGPKKALKLVKETNSLEEIVKKVNHEFEIDVLEVEKFFLEPPVVDSTFEFKKPDKSKMMDFLCREHDFSTERVEGTVNALLEALNEKGTQSKLDQWFG